MPFRAAGIRPGSLGAMCSASWLCRCEKLLPRCPGADFRRGPTAAHPPTSPAWALSIFCCQESAEASGKPPKGRSERVRIWPTAESSDVRWEVCAIHGLTWSFVCVLRAENSQDPEKLNNVVLLLLPHLASSKREIMWMIVNVFHVQMSPWRTAKALTTQLYEVFSGDAILSFWSTACHHVLPCVTGRLTA